MVRGDSWFAGLKQLGAGATLAAAVYLPSIFSSFLPAPGQGAICIETRSGDREIVELVQAINDEQTELALVAERAFLKALDGSCRTPIAGLAEVDGSKISFSGMVLSEEGAQVFETSDTCEANVQAARKMGKKAGDLLRQQAGADFFHHWS